MPGVGPTQAAVPSNLMPLGALPARFRRLRVLIVGCGDVGCRVARRLPAGVRVLALARSGAHMDALRAQGVEPLRGDLDQAASLQRLAGVATHVLHLAPPPGAGADDPRTRALVRALARRTAPRALIYGSTTGVYGDRAGAWVDETCTPRPGTDRARARLAAEGWVRALGRTLGTRVGILRIAAIYAPDRAGAPRERVLGGAPVLAAADDVYASRIHADDLARACLLALWRGRPQRVLDACDGTPLKMGDFLDLAADRYGLPRLPRISRAEAEQRFAPQRLAFLRESRRLAGVRLGRELRLRLHHPSPATGL